MSRRVAIRKKYISIRRNKRFKLHFIEIVKHRLLDNSRMPHQPGEELSAFRPNKLRYLVLPDPVKSQETKIEGSEYTIDLAKDPHAKPSEGTIIAVGKDCTEYTPGAKVLYGKFSGYEQLFDGVNYLILAETEILGERLVTPFDN